MTQINAKVECVLDCRDKLGEGIFWCPVDRALYWVDVPMPALVQIAGAGKRPVLYCRDLKLGARHSTLQAQVDLGHPDVPVRIVPCGCDASIRCRRS